VFLRIFSFPGSGPAFHEPALLDGLELDLRPLLNWLTSDEITDPTLHHIAYGICGRNPTGAAPLTAMYGEAIINSARPFTSYAKYRQQFSVPKNVTWDCRAKAGGCLSKYIPRSTGPDLTVCSGFSGGLA